tara:strand:+ start:719 stop:1072 length:354 start_codon:yes stop_codon:yes gene_type:complete
MPFFKKGSIDRKEMFPGFYLTSFANETLGAVSLFANIVEVKPNSGIELHVHPEHEEAILVLEGTIEFVLGPETIIGEEGDVLIVPASIVHAMHNKKSNDCKLVTVFPTTNPQRIFVE